VRVRPKFEAALETYRRIKAHDPHCRVILTVYEMKRLGRDAKLTALADHLTAHGIALEMLAGPLPGIYDPTEPAAFCSRSSPRWPTQAGLRLASRLRDAHRFHPSWSMAQPLIISTGFQGGSQMICTSTSVTLGTSAKVLLIESVM
jgi:hypothetical protein